MDLNDEHGATVADAQTFFDQLVDDEVIEDWEYIPTIQCYKVNHHGRTDFLTVMFINQSSPETIRAILVQ